MLYLSSDYRIVHDPRIIAKLCLVNKEHQVTENETPEDKQKMSECQQLVAYDGVGRSNIAQI